MSPPTLLLFGYGNPGRGDDGLGPRLIDCLEREGVPGRWQPVFLTAMQLQPEHACDLIEHHAVILVDAGWRTPAPFSFSPVWAKRDHSYTTHQLSPAALAAICLQTLGHLPPLWLLTIRGCRFDPGEEFSPSACRHLQSARSFLRNWVRRELPRVTGPAIHA
ncbi:MAG: hydrogenase maturation protease [Gammaproteobacteria bacterium]|nr:MAG: hydrogenase maturation protease [Gammaproteobacteria bacterium]